ncbi:hypothetical protein R1flu_012923 [Riccia fluitans]|uniref:SAM-dependent MTase RsmB/NOP-type domain-containing protein n=1 Tax=Riccia fluitans TaxID=41844 RepID=A0ABD1ZC17_9MARC
MVRKEISKMDGEGKESSAYGYRPKLVWETGVHKYLSQAYGSVQFDAICEALTRPCIDSTLRVNTLQASTQEVMEQLCKHLGADRQCSSSSPKFDVVDGAEGSVHLPVSDSGEGGCPKPEKAPGFSCSEHSLLKDVIMVRGRGPCEVDCGVEPDKPVKEVVVSRKCAEAVLRGANVFVPGVLACSLHVEKGDTVAVTVAVERPDENGGWSVGITRGTTLESEHALSQMGASSRSDHFIGVGRMSMSRTALFRESKGVAVEMSRRIFDLPPFHSVLAGRIFLQNLPSIVAVRVLDPKSGERILDMCAAPGGKTTAIGILMKNQGEIVALDRSHNKVLDIKRLADEMKLTCIQAYKLDATKCVDKELGMVMSADAPSQSEYTSSSNPVSTSSLSLYEVKAAARKEARKMKNRLASESVATQRIKGLQRQSFDRVLLDAPCSALGLRPRLFAGEETLESLRQHSCYQRKLFDQAVQLVRPGGILVYSTCTMNPGENEGVVRYALDTYDDLSLLPQEPRIGGPGLVGGRDVFDGMSCKEWLREGEEHLVQRFSPSESYDTIGFFIAKFAVA